MCDLFKDRLPVSPYHTNDFQRGLKIAGVEHAIKCKYIQPNGPTHKYWFVFDIDSPDALYGWHDAGAPPPNMVVINPKNNRGHLIYGLKVPVRTASDGRLKPLRYAAAIEAALVNTLKADPSYVGLVCKNPLSEDWIIHVWEEQLYDLDGLASWLDLTEHNDRRKNQSDYGLGRNCTLFDELRTWAYKAIRQGWPTYERWLMAVKERAHAYNKFTTPLSVNEVEHIAKSVAQYTHKNFSKAKFSAWQSIQGAKGGRAKGAAYSEKREKALELIKSGMKIKDIAELLEVDRKTITNWKKRASATC